MSTNVLSVVNKVLRKLRETTVLTITSNEYAELLTTFLEEVNTQVENAIDWEQLVSTFNLSTVASQSEYSITGSPEGSKIASVYDQTNDNYLIFSPSDVDYGLRVASPTEGTPLYWKYSGDDSNGDMKIQIYPVPDGVRTLKVKGKYLKGELVFTSPSTNLLTVPTLPLVLGTYALAVAERGEDGAESFEKADFKYKFALSDAIAIEEQRKGSTTTDWSVE